MNELERHFKKAAESIRMTDAEKSVMRFRIQQEIAPAAPAPISSTPSPYVWMFAPRMIAMLGVLLLVVVSTGSAYAAEGSLPGTPLYPVKTRIVEPLKIALAPTAQAKAQANADIAATRVQEAQALAAKGTLTSEAVRQISDNYNEHAKAALALAADIDAQDRISDRVDITVAVNTPPAAGDVTVAVEPTEPPSATSGVIAITATAPATLSISIEATSSKDKDEESTTSSASNTRNRNGMTFSGRAPSAAISASSTASTTKQNARHSFIRTLRASLSAQAQILEQLDAKIRLEQDERGEN